MIHFIIIGIVQFATILLLINQGQDIKRHEKLIEKLIEAQKNETEILKHLMK